jgi:hypothetical protein
MEPSRVSRCFLCRAGSDCLVSKFASLRWAMGFGGQLLQRGMGQHQFYLEEKTCGKVGSLCLHLLLL